MAILELDRACFIVACPINFYGNELRFYRDGSLLLCFVWCYYAKGQGIISLYVFFLILL